MKNIVVLGFVIITGTCFGQATTLTSSGPSQESILFSKNSYQNIFEQNFDFGLMNSPNTNHYLTMAPLHLNNPFMSGMFCKFENKFESLSKIAPRFRLGSLNYTEWMEGKREIYTRYWK